VAVLARVAALELVVAGVPAPGRDSAEEPQVAAVLGSAAAFMVVAPEVEESVQVGLAAVVVSAEPAAVKPASLANG
jgi:hypothetical protein